MSRSYLLYLLLLGLGACEQSEDSAAELDSGPERTLDAVVPFHDAAFDAAASRCAQLAPAQCSQDARCRAISGQLLQPVAQCMGPETAIGCMAATSGCGAAITRALSKAGEIWEFTSTCVPDGFTDVTAADAGAPRPGSPTGDWPSCAQPACDQRALTDCTATPGCTERRARPFDAKKQCKGNIVTLSCVPASGFGCAAVMTQEIDPQGKTWEFGSSCGNGWTSTSFAELGYPQLSSVPEEWPPCS